jgi:hypothetical protein
MRQYAVTFEGTEYNLCDEAGNKLGFFVSVMVRAEEPEQAIDLAFQKLISSERYQATFEPDDHPNGMLAVSDCAEILEPDPSEVEVSGICFYLEQKADDGKLH